MEKPLKGEVIVIHFPFTNMSASKRRPALVLADIRGDDVITCPISSQSRGADYAISLEDSDFSKGKLPLASFIRPNVLFTADKSLIEKKVGVLKNKKTDEVIEEICRMLRK
ncbi:type II toxin-antitoxin system PemK/MazF family toxin [Candidatus Woesearchaeota archaeon]|nr:type II toxin-antitoxin system PemK/MazF family toxin [Candidatus Woesearchaeota archaeon]